MSKQENSQPDISYQIQPSPQQISPQVVSIQPQQSSLRQQSISNSQQQSLLEQAQACKACVGMVRAVWLNNSGKKEYLNYGTGFAVSSRLILTCAHNIYNQEIKAVAHQIVFIPNHEGYINHYTKKYESIKSQYFQFINLQRGQNFAILPTLNQICLIALEKDIDLSYFIGVALHDLGKGDEVSVAGFPSRKYSRIVNMQTICLARTYLQGKIASIKDWIMDYTMKTKVGMSGSPILYYDKINKKFVAVGIHTHSGDGETNRGVYLNQFALEKIRQFQQYFYLEHQIPKRICFNERIVHPSKNKNFYLEDVFQSTYNILKMETIEPVVLKYPPYSNFFQNYYQE